MNYPKIIVGGFPNSGTSFLCHLIHEMGFSAGPPELLKGADEHNRWGYWEYLPIRTALWGQLPDGFRVENPDSMLTSPLYWMPDTARIIQNHAAKNNVEVYKDNLLPWVYRLLPHYSKYIIISRDPRRCYESPVKGGIRPYPMPFEVFEHAMANYLRLSQHYLEKDRDTIRIAYDCFHTDFNWVVERIARHIGIELRSEQYDRLSQIFRPRVDKTAGPHSS